LTERTETLETLDHPGLPGRMGITSSRTQPRPLPTRGWCGGGPPTRGRSSTTTATGSRRDPLPQDPPGQLDRRESPEPRGLLEQPDRLVLPETPEQPDLLGRQETQDLPGLLE